MKALPAYYLNSLGKSKYTSLYSRLLFGIKTKGKSLNKFYKIGIGHILSISGLHISSLTMLIYFILSLLIRIFVPLYIPIFYWTLPVSLGLSYAYILYIGPAIPRLRAFLLILFFSVSFVLKLFRRKYLTLLISFLIVLLVFPGSYKELSLYYSYLSVLAIYFVAGKKTSLFLISYSIFVFLLPLSLYTSGSVNILSILANVIFVSLFSFIYYPSFLLFLPISIFTKTYFLHDLLSVAFYNLVSLFYNLTSTTIIQLGVLSLKELISLYVVLFSLSFFRERYILVILLLFIFFIILLYPIERENNSCLSYPWGKVIKKQALTIVDYRDRNTKRLFLYIQQIPHDIDILYLGKIDNKALYILNGILKRHVVNKIVILHKELRKILVNVNYTFKRKLSIEILNKKQINKILECANG